LTPELRDQLRKARLDEERASNQLQKAKAKVAKLEVDLSNFRENTMAEFVTSAARPSDQVTILRISLSAEKNVNPRTWDKMRSKNYHPPTLAGFDITTHSSGLRRHTETGYICYMFIEMLWHFMAVACKTKNHFLNRHLHFSRIFCA
jgi:hypothetical protein